MVMSDSECSATLRDRDDSLERSRGILPMLDLRPMPRTRGECPEARPCPYASRCRHGLPTGRCVLDLIDRHGNMSLERVGDELGVTRERVRQIERKALRTLLRRGVALVAADLVGLHAGRPAPTLPRSEAVEPPSTPPAEKARQMGSPGASRPVSIVTHPGRDMRNRPPAERVGDVVHRDPKPENVVDAPLVRPAGPIDPKYIRRAATLRLHNELNRFLGIGRPATRRELALHEQIDRRLLADPGGADAWIVSELGCTPAMVARRRKALGLGPSDRRRRRPPRHPVVTRVDAALRASPESTNVTIAKVARADLETVSKRRGALGLGPSAWKARELRAQAEVQRLLRAASPLTNAEIARRAHASRKMVRRWRYELALA